MTESLHRRGVSLSASGGSGFHITSHTLEACESRVLLSASIDGQADQNTTHLQLSDAAIAMAISPQWFEDLSPQLNASGGVSVQVIDGQEVAVDSGIEHEWLIQLTADSALAAGSVAGVGELLGLADIGVQVVRGLGGPGPGPGE